MTSIIQILLALVTFLLPIAIITSIIFLILSLVQKDNELKKKKFGKISLWLFLAPIITLFALVTIWGIINTVSSV